MAITVFQVLFENFLDINLFNTCSNPMSVCYCYHDFNDVTERSSSTR